MIHTVKGFGMVNEAEIDIFLELSCFFNEHSYYLRNYKGFRSSVPGTRGRD